MKMILNWLSDPFVHIAIVVLVLIKLAASWSSEADAHPTSARMKGCSVCRSAHQLGSACPESPRPWGRAEALARSPG